MGKCFKLPQKTLVGFMGGKYTFGVFKCFYIWGPSFSKWMEDPAEYERRNLFP